MVHSPSWEANWFAASQEIPHISRNPKVHYRTHKRPPPASILGQPNPVHIPTSHLLEIHPNIIHPSTPRSLQWSLSLRFPTKTLYTRLSSPIRATCPAHMRAWSRVFKCYSSFPILQRFKHLSHEESDILSSTCGVIVFLLFVSFAPLLDGSRMLHNQRALLFELVTR